jgi:predicted  nucleic acid-binding Zn-ribbon protein
MQVVKDGAIKTAQDAPAVGSTHTLKTLPEVLAALSAVQSKETALAASLSALLEAREPLQSSLARLAALTQTVQGLKDESGSIANKVGLTAQTAERVRGKVQALDEEMKRVREAGERVAQVMDLKVLFGYLYLGYRF